MGEKVDKIIFESIGKYFRSRYKCSVCGKESSESQDIFDCLYGHIYNKDNKENMVESRK